MQCGFLSVFSLCNVGFFLFSVNMQCGFIPFSVMQCGVLSVLSYAMWGSFCSHFFAMRFFFFFFFFFF